MKKILFLILIAATIVACSPSQKKSDKADPDINDLPAINLTLVSGEKVMATSLPGNSILIFFGPDCDHCQRQAEDIRSHLEIFNAHMIYFIAANPRDEIIRFAEQYQFRGYSNVFFAQAEAPEVNRVLGPMAVPTLYIYSKEKRLVKKFVNETSMEAIAEYL